MRLKNRTEEITKELGKVNAEISDFKQSNIEDSLQRFHEAGGCDSCRGRGWIVTWDTLDCVQGSYAQYGACPEEECTPKTREKSGLSPVNRKHDRWNSNSTWSATHTPEEARQLEDLLERQRNLSCDKTRELARWMPSEGKLVKIVSGGRGKIERRPKVGAVGIVIKKFNNNFGTEKLIILDKDGTKHWASVSLVSVVDPEPDSRAFDKIMKAEREKNSVPIIVTVTKKTGKAAFIKTTTGKETWVPFSQVPTLAKASLGSTVSALIPMWLVNQKQLIGVK